MRNQKETMKKVLRLIGPYKHFVILSFGFALISAILTLYAPILMRWQDMRNQKETMKKVLRLIGPYKHFVILSFGFALISAILTLYAPILIGQAVDLILDEGKVEFAGIFQIIKKCRNLSDYKKTGMDHRNNGACTVADESLQQ